MKVKKWWGLRRESLEGTGPWKPREDSASRGVGESFGGLCEGWEDGLDSHCVPQSWKGGRVASRSSPLG